MPMAGFSFKQVPLSRIDPNPKNPRGINIREEDDKLGHLKDSINEFGILVPLVLAPRGDRFVLVDGERRFWAAKELGLSSVPAYISRNAVRDRDIIIRMFHIHHNREQWGAIQQCMALEEYYTRIRAEVSEEEDAISQVALIAEKLARSTGIDISMARDRVLFLRWPVEIKEALYNVPDSEREGSYLYITEIEKHIILPALANYPEYFENVPVDDVRDFLFRKYVDNLVGRKISVRDAVPLVRYKATSLASRKKVLKIFDELVKDKEMTFEEAREEFFRNFPNASTEQPPSPRKLLSQLERFRQTIDLFDVEALGRDDKRTRANKTSIMEAIEKLVESLKDLREALDQNQSEAE